MRHIIFLDSKISNEEYLAWRLEDEKFWKKYADISPTYEVIVRNFSDFPMYLDSDGDLVPTREYLKSLTVEVEKKYGKWGTDFIMMFVHEDHWESGSRVGKGLWGQNYSYKFGNQCFEYCRWDKDNPANTFGTAYHERMHTPDAILRRELRVNIEPILDVTNYDMEVVHGKSDVYEYIKYKENTDALKKIAPYLRQAFGKRKANHETQIKGLMSQIINLANQVIALLRK